MNTPICDFVMDYAASHTIRMHMPGHKGKSPLFLKQNEDSRKNGSEKDGSEKNGSETKEELSYEEAFSRIFSYDITEIETADDLFHPKGIIEESEKNASKVFGCDTYYSTEGSSLCIRAMLSLCKAKAEREIEKEAKNAGQGAWVLAARNVHQTFVSACALLDLDAEWIGSSENTFLSVNIGAGEVKNSLLEGEKKHGSLPCCVYLTSPDYTGHILPVKEIAEVCHEKGVPLVVDNAHGAYLHFLKESLHPMDLGADLCCDSAHKTLPALTGCAYLHVKNGAFSSKEVKDAMSLFASTSPSWLLLQSLDLLNPLLEGSFREKLSETIWEVKEGKEKLSASGIFSLGEEPLKITIETGDLGYTGEAFAEYLRDGNAPVEVEFSDRDRVVLMISPGHEKEEIRKTIGKILSAPKKAPISKDEKAEGSFSEKEAGTARESSFPEKVLSLREAVFSEKEEVPVKESAGRVAALGRYGCPPAVPIVMPGERIGEKQAALLAYYGHETCEVVK